MAVILSHNWTAAQGLVGGALYRRRSGPGILVSQFTPATWPETGPQGNVSSSWLRAHSLWRSATPGQRNAWNDWSGGSGGYQTALGALTRQEFHRLQFDPGVNPPTAVPPIIHHPVAAEWAEDFVFGSPNPGIRIRFNNLETVPIRVVIMASPPLNLGVYHYWSGWDWAQFRIAEVPAIGTTLLAIRTLLPSTRYALSIRWCLRNSPSRPAPSFIHLFTTKP